VSDLFRFPNAQEHDPQVEAWFDAAGHDMRWMARAWFERMRGCGPDVRELLHDRCPWACAGDAAFAYVNAFAAHVNVGFLQGTSLDDPAGLMEGAGKRMRHVKLRWGEPVNEAALAELITAAYRDMKARVKAEG
jgi:hypothetical protein